MKIVFGSSGKHLSSVFDPVVLINLKNKNFPDGEVYIEFDDRFDSNSVAVIQSTNNSDSLVELFLTISLLKDLGVKKIVAVIPYFGYARQDRKVNLYSPISVKTIIEILQSLGIDYCITIDIHSGAAKDFFDVPLINLSPVEIFSLHYKHHHDFTNALVVAPDFGAEKRNSEFAYHLGLDLCIINKHRSAPGVSEVIEIIGQHDLRGKDVIIVDDIVDSAGTLCNSAKFLKDVGVSSVTAYITHGVLSGNALSKISGSFIDHLYITDTIFHPKIQESKVKVISIAHLIHDCLSKIAESL